MERSFCTYTIKEYPENSFYIGANSEKGFVLTPGGIFEEDNFDRVFILKGGPGTGKSTFMKKAAKEAEKKGRTLTGYYCSSDPDSLDALIIENGDEKTLIIDGTHPHIREMKYPGAVSEIINLSVLWNTELLTERREKIRELSDLKSDCFENAYRYLAAAAELDRSQIKISKTVLNEDKMKSAVVRFAAPYKKFKGTVRTVYTEAFSMSGTVSSDVFVKSSKQIYYLSDSMGISRLFLKELSKELKKEKVAHTEIISPVSTAVISGIFIDGASILITHQNYKDEMPLGKTINMKRFLSDDGASLKGRYRFGEKCKNALYEGAADALLKASNYHFELENIYSPAMNFKKLNKIYREKISPFLI